MLFLNIFASSAAPLLLLIGVGFLLDKRFHIDIPTLSRLSFYIFSPVLLFTMIHETDLHAGEILTIGGFTIAHMAILYVLAIVAFSIRPLAEKRTILSMGTIFTNSGNYGIPLMLLAFGQRAASIIAIILTTQVILLFTIGIVLIDGSRGDLKKPLSQLLKYPILYAIALAFAMRALHLPVPDLLQTPLDVIVGGFIPIALFTLGAQLSRIPIGGDIWPVSAITLTRLIVSPLVAAALLLLFDVEPEISRVFILAAGLPVAVNVFVLAVEFNHEPELASRMVFWTTLFSGVTIPLLLMLVR
jgi:predicted permease